MLGINYLHFVHLKMLCKSYPNSCIAYLFQARSLSHIYLFQKQSHFLLLVCSFFKVLRVFKFVKEIRIYTLYSSFDWIFSFLTNMFEEMCTKSSSSTILELLQINGAIGLLWPIKQLLIGSNSICYHRQVCYFISRVSNVIHYLQIFK